MTPETAILAVSALHLGFQATVTVVVYPALADVPATDFLRAHAAHSRRIVALVAPVYVVVASGCLWLLLAGPYSPAALLAVAGNAVAALTTAFVAAPAHGRLGTGRTDAVMVRLLRADRVRTAATVVAVVGGVLAVR